MLNLKKIIWWLIYSGVLLTPLHPCTTILVGKSLTKDGAILHAHNEDMGHKTVGRVWKVNSNASTTTDSIWVPYEMIKNQNQTFGYWASGNTQAIELDELNTTNLPYDNILVGMNEKGLTMSCNWMYSKEVAKEEVGIRRYAIRQLILERCATAKEAVLFIGSIIETVGQADWGGLTYVLADSDEGWIVETTANTWVAKKLKDDEIIVIANRYTIGTEYDLSSQNLVELASDSLWYTPSQGLFNFKEVYGDPDFMNDAYDENREHRVHQLLGPLKGSISSIDLMGVLKDQYQGTDLFSSPIEKELIRTTCNDQNLNRPICTNMCQSSFVAHLQKPSDKSIGPILWFTLASPAYGPYFPLYPHGTKLPYSFSVDHPKETNRTSWWVYRHAQQSIDVTKNETINLYRSKATNKTLSMMEKQSSWESKMLKAIKSGKMDKSIRIANRATKQMAISSLKFVQQSLRELNK